LWSFFVKENTLGMDRPPLVKLHLKDDVKDVEAEAL